MALKTLVNHKGFKLEADAADSLARYEHDHGVITINSAYRSQAEQNALIARWRAGGKYNRPPYLYEPAAVSKHTSGVAIDTPNAPARSAGGMINYGWRFKFAYDVVHLEYDRAYDKNIPATKPSQNSAVLRRGSTGAAVLALQRQLKTNYPLYAGKLVLDGIYGPATVAAVKEFQRRAGLTQDGIAGPLTRARLGV